MKLEMRVNMAPYVAMSFQSEYSPDNKTAALDLIVQMRPHAAQYPAIAQKIEELKQAYGAR